MQDPQASRAAMARHIELHLRAQGVIMADRSILSSRALSVRHAGAGA